MSTYRVYALLVLFANFTATGVAQTATAKPNPTTFLRPMPGLAPQLAPAPVTFEVNQGQFAASVRFVSRREGMMLAVSDSQIVFSLTSPDGSAANVVMKMAGANPTPTLSGEEPANLTSNYFIGNDSSRWHKGVKSFRRVRMSSIYPGVDLVFHGDRGEPEFDFVVAPGADPSAIRYRLSGAQKVALNAAGDLTVAAAGREFAQRKPVLYQMVAGRRQELAGRFVRRRGNEIGFVIGPYDRSAELVIDPTILFTKTFPAPNSSANGFASGPGGAFYIAGSVGVGASLDANAPSNTKGPKNSGAAFVAKIDRAGNVVWVTYLSGSQGAAASALTVDPDGFIYVAGYTNATDFPLAGSKPFQSKNNSSNHTTSSNTFVAKLDPTGANLIYSSYFGGSGDDYPASVALDSSRNLIVAGGTTSPGLPTRGAGGAAPYQKNFSGDAGIYLAKFNADASDLVFLTYLAPSGSGFSYVSQMVQDSDGTYVLVGTTTAANFSTKGANVITKFGGGQQDAFVTRINAGGTDLVFSTLLGGSGDDFAHGVAITPTRQILVGGATSSQNFPTKNAPQPSYAGGARDGFLTRFDPNGVLVQSSYYGTKGDDYISNVAAAANFVAVVLQSDTRTAVTGGRGLQPRDADSGPTNFIMATSPDDMKFLLGGGDNFTFGQNGIGGGTGQCSYAPPVPDPNDFNAPRTASFCCPGYASDSTGSGSVPTLACVLLDEATQITNGIPNFLLHQDGGGCCDPVSTGNGEMTDAASDLPAVGPMQLHFERYYASQMKTNGFSGALGTNWMHNLEHKLAVNGSSAVVTLFPGTQFTFSASGSSWQVAATEKYNYQLLAVSGGGFRFADPNASRIYSFNAAGKLTSIQDRNGNAITVTQGTAGPTSATDGFGATLTFSYDASGHLIQAQDQSGRTVKFTYTASDLTGVTNVLSQQLSYKYATGSLLVSKTYPAGNTPNTQQYDANGRVSSQTTAGGKTTQLAYATGNTTTVTDPLGSHYAQAHSSRGAVTQVMDSSGAATNMTYDGSNRRLSLTDRLGSTVTATYDPAGGQQATYKDQLGAVTRYTYTTQSQDGFTYYLLSQVTYADNSSRSLTYDPKGNVLSIADPGGAKTSYTYDAHGLLATAANALGGVTTMVYNSDGTMASIAPPSGDIEKYSYDDKKRLAVVTHADGKQKSYRYNDLDEAIALNNELGNTRAASYAFNNILTSDGDYAGQAVTLAYNADNRMVSQTDRNGKTTRFSYDQAGRMQNATSPAGLQSIRQYDAMGHTIALADAVGTVETRTYDKEGRISATADGAGRSVAYTYDAIGDLLSVTMGPYSAAMSYDTMHRLSMLVDGSNVTTTYSYGRTGLFSAVKRGSATVAVTRDAIGNVVGITDPNGKLWSSVFDSSNRLASRTDPNGSKQSYTYDSRRRLSRITMPDGTANFTYDAGGRLTQASYSDGTELNYTYDKNSNLMSANGIALAYDAEGAIVSSNGIAMVRDDDGKVVSMALSPTLAITYAYDNRGMPVKITDSAGGEVDLAFDPGQLLSSISRSNGIATTLTHDGSGKLASVADGSLASIAVSRDGAGKIVSSDRNLPASPAIGGGAVSYSYDDGSQISGATYDKQGRLISDGQRTYTWDMASRLLSYSDADGAATMTYDARGNMISRTSGGVTRSYVLNYAFPLPVVSVIRDGSNQDLRYYVYAANGMPLYSIEAADNTRHFFHYDENGSTTFLTDDSGAVTDTYGISPYGEVVTHIGSTENPFTFMGSGGIMQQDQAALYSMRARFYDAASARFLSRDPIVHSASPLAVNPYPYAEGNPLIKFDPSGLDSAPDNSPQNTSCYNLQCSSASSWEIFRARMAQHFAQYQLGQQIIANIIQQAYTDANNYNSTYCGWGSCRWGMTRKDPLALAKERLNAVAKRENFAPAVITQITDLIGHGGSSVDLALGVANIIGDGGSSLIGQDGAGLVNNYGASYLTSMANQVISHDGGSVVSHDGGSILAVAVGQVISNDGGSVISNDGGSVVSNDGGSVVSHDGGSVVSHDGASVVSHDGASLIGTAGSGLISSLASGLFVDGNALVAAGGGN